MRNGENAKKPCIDDIFEEKKAHPKVIETPGVEVIDSAGFCPQTQCDKRFNINTGQKFGSCALRQTVQRTQENLGEDLLGHIGRFSETLVKGVLNR